MDSVFRALQAYQETKMHLVVLVWMDTMNYVTIILEFSRTFYDFLHIILADCYFDILDAEDCAKCDSSCKTCLDTSTTCSSCFTSSLKVIVANKCVCGVGYYDQIGTCELCDTSCFECYGPSMFECISCASPFVLDP